MSPSPAIQMASLLLACAALVPPATADPTPPLPPRDFQGTYNATGNTLTLTWLPPDMDYEYHYVLYRGTTKIADVSDLTYTDAALPGTSLYTIQAVRPSDDFGRSSAQQYSAPAMALVSIIIIDGSCEIIIVGSTGVGLHPECLG